MTICNRFQRIDASYPNVQSAHVVIHYREEEDRKCKKYCMVLSNMLKITLNGGFPRGLCLYASLTLMKINGTPSTQQIMVLTNAY